MATENNPQADTIHTKTFEAPTKIEKKPLDGLSFYTHIQYPINYSEFKILVALFDCKLPFLKYSIVLECIELLSSLN